MEISVVLVDDDPVVLFIHQILIKRAAITREVQSFKDGKSALDFIRAHEEKRPFLVFLDINMPVMNGWEFLETMEGMPIRDDIFVAIVSSSINTHDLEKAKKYDRVIEYLEKPVSKELLQGLHKKVSALLEGDR